MTSAPLKKTGIGQISICLALGTGLGFGFNSLLLNLSVAPFSGNLPVLILLLAISAITFYRTFKVKRYKEGKDPKVPASYAASAYILAKSAIIAGFTLAGIYCGALLTFWFNSNPALAEKYWLLTFLNLVAGLILAIAGIIGEYFCKTDPPGTPA
jgi:magnesium-transporting ATPase (P-type)